MVGVVSCLQPTAHPQPAAAPGHAPHAVRTHVRPFNSGCLPLNYSDNPGVNSVLYREGCAGVSSRSPQLTSAGHASRPTAGCSSSATLGGEPS
jgi:hypothetical protein